MGHVGTMGRQAKQVELKDMRREVAGFARLMNTYDIAELELEVEGLTMKLRKQVNASPARTVGVEAEAVSKDSRLTITAPMVGTFYRAPAPDEEPYISVGDTILPCLLYTSRCV